MARLYDRASVKKQLDVLSHHIEEFYPGHYAEHIATCDRSGIGERAIMIILELDGLLRRTRTENTKILLKNKELELKVSALGKALLEMGERLAEMEVAEIDQSMPPLPIIGGEEVN